MGTFIKSFYTLQKKWVFITTDFITVNNKGSTMNNSPDSTTMMADSTITKKNQVSTMNTSSRKTDSTMTDFTTTDSTTTTSRRMKTDFTTMPKRDFTMMAMNRITKSKMCKRTNRRRKTNPMSMSMKTSMKMRRNKLFINHAVLSQQPNFVSL